MRSEFNLFRRALSCDDLAAQVRWLLLIWCCAAASFFLVFDEVYPNAEKLHELHDSILAHTADSPSAYRLLTPYSIQAATNLLERFVPLGRKGFPAFIGYVAYAAAAISFSIAALYRLYARLFDWRNVVIGMGVTTLGLITAMQDVIQPWSWLEPGLYALGMLFILDRRNIVLGILIALASLNRETAVYLVALYFFANWPKLRSSFRPWLITAIYALIWAGIYGWIRYWIGPRPRQFTVAVVMARNLNAMSFFLIATKLFLLLGPLWLFVWPGWKAARSETLKYAAIAVPLFVLTAAPFSIWNETRLLTPFYCVLVPLALYGITARTNPSTV